MKETRMQAACKAMREVLAGTHYGKAFERFLNNNRGSGNTAILLEAAKAANAKLITATHEHADQLDPAHCRALGDGSYQGRNVIDNYAIYKLMQECRALEECARTLMEIIEFKKLDKHV